MKRSSLLIIVAGAIIFVIILFTIAFGSYSSVYLHHDEDTSIQSSSSAARLLIPKIIKTKNNHQDANSPSVPSNISSSTKSKMFIPHLVYDCDARERQYLKKQRWTLAIGIPSVDRPASLERRQRQRDTWFKYSSVYSSILPRYLLGLHPNHDYKMSGALVTEIQGLIDSERSGGGGGSGDEHKVVKNDIIVFDLKEGKPATDKTVGGAGYWGLESEVGMSRKAYFWYCHAAASYVNADFFAKADDDLFLRSNIVSSILQQVVSEKLISTSFLASDRHQESNVKEQKTSTNFCSSHNHLYWGRVMKWGAKKGDANSKFPFVGGMFILMSSPLVRWIASSPVPAVNSKESFHGDKGKYKQTNHDHEDVMVGRWFYDAKLPVCILSDPRFHDVHVGANLGKVRSNSIGMHHLTVEEYSQFMDKYADTQDSAERKEVVDDAMKKLRTAIQPSQNRAGDGGERENLWHGYAKVIGM